MKAFFADDKESPAGDSGGAFPCAHAKRQSTQRWSRTL